MDVASMSPAEIDKAMGEQMGEKYRREAYVERAMVDVFYGADARKVYGRGPQSWNMTRADAIAAVRAAAADENMPGYKRSEHANRIERYDAAAAAVAEVAAVIAGYQAEFVARGGWTRAFLVTNTGGHVHSSMDCSQCYPTTQYQLMWPYSGKDEEHIVADAGERACTVCYPSAPVGVTGTKMFTDDEVKAAAAREERAKAKADRDAKRIANALTPDGSEFVVSYPGYNDREGRESFKTERAAVQWVVQYMAWDSYSTPGGTEDKTPAYDAIIAAVAEKHGRSVEDVRAEVESKVAAKIKRDAR